VLELLQQHPEMASGYIHEWSLEENLAAFKESPDSTSAVEFKAVSVRGVEFQSVLRRRRGAAGVTGSKRSSCHIAVLRHLHDGSVEPNTAYTKQTWAQAVDDDVSPPSRVCMDFGTVVRLLRFSLNGVTNRVMEVEWLPPAWHSQRVTERSAANLTDELDGGGRPIVTLSPPFQALGGRRADRAQAVPRHEKRGDGTFIALTAVQHGRLPVVDTGRQGEGPVLTRWCLVSAFFEHCLLVRYPDLSCTTALFGEHAKSWRIVLPGSPGMAIRMGLLGKRTKSILYDEVIGVHATYSGSAWTGGGATSYSNSAAVAGSVDCESDDSSSYGGMSDEDLD
jgi:hypothetical protein